MRLNQRMKEIIKKLNKSDYYIHLIFFVIALLFVGRGIDFNLCSHFFNGGDTAQWLNFEIFLEKGLRIWWSSESGFIPPMAFWVLPYNLILQTINLFTDNIILTINIFWILLFYLVQLSFFLFYRIFLKREIALVGTFFSIFNIYFLIYIHTPVALNFIGLVALPLMYYLFHSFYFDKKFVFAFLYITFQLILFRNLNILLFSNLFVPVFFWLMNPSILRNQKKEFYIKTLLIWTLSILVCFVYLVNLSFYYNASGKNEQTITYNESTLSAQSIYNLNNVYRFILNYGFLKMNGQELQNYQGKDFSILYLSNLFFILVSFIPMLLFTRNMIFYSNKNNKNIRRDRIIIFSIILIFIFLAKGLNAPLRGFSEFLYSNYIFTMLFRNSAKYFILLMFPILTLFIMKYSKKDNVFSILLFVYVSVNVAVGLFFYKPIHRYWNSTLPNDYVEFTNVINDLHPAGKFLVLPISESFAGFMKYKDGYGGPDRLFTLSDKDLLIKKHSVVTPFDYVKLLDDIKEKPNNLEQYVSILGYQYIILKNDVIFSSVEESEKQTAIIKQIDFKKWDKIFENKTFALLKLKDEYFPGKIFLNNDAALTLIQIDETKYKLNISLRNRSDIVFLDSFNKDWKLYPNRHQSGALCTASEYLEITNTTVCAEKRSYFALENLAYIYQDPIFDDTHIMNVGYANRWTIDPEYIKQNFSKDYYKENPDGSIDIELTLYFKPQSYFYLGLIVSGLTLAGLLGYLGYDIIRRKQKKNAENIRKTL